MTPWAAGIIGLIVGFCLGVIAAALCVGSSDSRFPLIRSEPMPGHQPPPLPAGTKLAPPAGARTAVKPPSKPRAKRSVKHGR
jgi:hypothetical protein